MMTKWIRCLLKGFALTCWLSALLAAPTASARPAAVLMEKAPETAYQMAPVVVTATRAETPQPDVAANVVVIDEEQIRRTPAANVAELLQYVPGVYVEFNAGFGSVATARIQGAESRHVAVYMDGVPLNQQANPQTDLSLIPIAAIGRVEIYKGAASSAWGSALGGVINIITKAPERATPFSAEAQVSYGESDTLKSRAGISGTVDRFGYLLSFTHDESDGFVPHTSFETDAVYAKFNLDVGAGSRLNYAFSYTDGDQDDPLPPFDFWDDIRQRRLYHRLLYETDLNERLTLVLEGRYHRYKGKIEDVYPQMRILFNDYEEDLWGGSARLDWDIAPANALTVGADGDWGTYDWFNFSREYDTGNWAVYANDTHTWGILTLQAGLRYDDSETFGGYVSPSVGAVVHLMDDRARIRAQVAKGFSAPPAAWVHDPVYGNPDLDPETALNYQVGGEIELFEILHLELNLFLAEVDDLLRYDFDSRIYQNIDSVTRRGVEGAVRADLPCGLDLSFGASYVDVRDDQTDKVINDIPRTQLKAAAVYENAWTTHSLIGRYVDHNSSFPETRDEKFIFDYQVKFTLPVPPKYGRIQLYGAVYNLFDSNYVYRDAWPKPGRWVEAGLRMTY